MRQRQKIINLYEDRNIRSIKYVISIGDEEDLNQFWHHFHTQSTNDYRLLYRFISLMYTFSEHMLESHKELFFELIIEQNEEVFYCTVWNAVVSKYLEARLKEQQSGFDYRIDSKRITVKLAKERLAEEGVRYDDKQEIRRRQIIASVREETRTVQPVYEFLHEDDREEILKLCDDMSDIMYRVNKAGFDDDVLIRLRSCLSMFALSLMSYPQLSHISNLSVEFSVLINTSQQQFRAMLCEEFALIEGFIHNLERWANTLFVMGGADLHFMDNSLKADLDMIKMLIEPKAFELTSTDDIFDF